MRERLDSGTMAPGRNGQSKTGDVSIDEVTR
jgi:hypothetical protein